MRLDRFQSVALLVLRVVLGMTMLAHGYSKVTSSGFHQHAGFVSHLGMPWWFAFFSTAAEVGGGILLILGLFARFAAASICAELVVIIATVHWKNGFLGQGGYQLPLALDAMAFALIFLGAGAISVDAMRGTGRISTGRKKKN